MYERYIDCLRKMEGDALLLQKLQQIDDERPIKKINREEEDSEYHPAESISYTLVMVVNPAQIYE